MKVGDKLKFKKFDWIITEVWTNHLTKEIEGRYRVRRRYFKGIIPLFYTKQTYPIFKYRWEYFKQMLEGDPNFHYNQTSYVCTQHKRQKKLMSKEEFQRLGVGSIIESPNGNRRTVLRVVNNRYLILRKLFHDKESINGKETAYLYSDISNKYKVVKF